jgi:hypothetical protein
MWAKGTDLLLLLLSATVTSYCSCCEICSSIVDDDAFFDVVVYRATPAGIAAAIAAATTLQPAPQAQQPVLPVRVLLLEPTGHIGGMATEGGIGLRDALTDDLRSNPKSSQYRWGQLNAQDYLDKINKNHINKNNNTHHHKHELPHDDIAIWQPDHWVGEQSFWTLLNESHVEVMKCDNNSNNMILFAGNCLQHLLFICQQVCLDTDLVEGPSGVRIEEGPPRRITAIQLQQENSNCSIRWISAKYFIDASYEGDLMQASGVDFTVEREARSMYHESWAGVTNHSESQFPLPINPFDGKGRLLRYIQQQHGGVDPRKRVGAADTNVMAYSYRVCLTRDANRIPITPPRNFKATDFELARRLVMAERRHNKSLSQPWLYLDYMGYGQIPNMTMKYDACCGFSPVGIDATGLAVGYATASRAERALMAEEHRYYVQGLLWFWQSDASIPDHIRKENAQYGLCPDAWPENDHFPRQLYVREAARMVGERVFTQQDRKQSGICRHDSIAVGSWGFDIHEMQRVALFTGSRWTTWNEGSTGYRQGDHVPFEIPYWVILPKRKELTNLLVPNCPSVSHVAFAAIRVEPTLWQLGVAAGTAAALGVMSHDSVPRALHDIEISLLQLQLTKQGSPIHWPLNISDCGLDRIFSLQPVI